MECHNSLPFLNGQLRTLLQQGHRVTSIHKPKYISHMAQHLRLLLPSPSSSPTFPCDIASVKHRPLQCFIFFYNPNSSNHHQGLCSLFYRFCFSIQCSYILSNSSTSPSFSENVTITANFLFLLS